VKEETMALNAVPFLTAEIVEREQARRRVLLWSIAALTFLSISPVVGHHLAARADETLLQGTDMIGALCLIALHMLMAPLHEIFHVALVGGLAYATWDRLRAWRRMRRTLRCLDAQRPSRGDVFWRAAASVGLAPARVRVVSGLPNPAFTAGLLRPVVYVSAELAEWLSDAELRAVLAHEGAHVARRDPLRLSVLRFFACTLFWIPALRRLAADVADEAEVQADDAAARDHPLELASAILSVAAWGGGSARRTDEDPPRTDGDVAFMVGFTCHDLIERRVRRLAGEDARPRTHVTRRSLFVATVVLLLGWGSGVVMAHPMPAVQDGAGHAQHQHCQDHTGSALSHLWCGTWGGAGAADCPHRHG
jgi:Zn-dependent protease with chaperone function